MTFACWERGALVLALLAFFGLGCGPSEAVEAQRERLERENQARLEALDRIEARLLEASARSRGWMELGRRHEQVTEFACETAAHHATAMKRHFHRQAERARMLKSAATRVAAADRYGREDSANKKRKSVGN